MQIKLTCLFGVYMYHCSSSVDRNTNSYFSPHLVTFLKPNNSMINLFIFFTIRNTVQSKNSLLFSPFILFYDTVVLKGKYCWSFCRYIAFLWLRRQFQAKKNIFKQTSWYKNWAGKKKLVTELLHLTVQASTHPRDTGSLLHRLAEEESATDGARGAGHGK